MSSKCPFFCFQVKRYNWRNFLTGVESQAVKESFFPSLMSFPDVLYSQTQTQTLKNTFFLCPFQIFQTCSQLIDLRHHDK